MISFDLNLEAIDKTIFEIEQLIKEYDENLEHLNNSIKNVDSCWQDNNTPFFITHATKDNNMISLQMESLQDIVKIMYSFSSCIKTCMRKNLDVSLKKIKFNSKCIDSAIDNLTHACSELSNALVKLEKIVLPIGFAYKSKYNNLVSSLKSLNTSINSTKSLLVKINDEVKKLYNEFQDKVNKNMAYEIGDKDIMFYKSRIIEPNFIN